MSSQSSNQDTSPPKDESSPRINVSLWITGDGLDPMACTRHLGVVPTEVRVKGEARPRKLPPARSSSWALDLKNQRLYSTDEAVALILAPIWPVRDQLKHFVEKHKLEVFVAVNVTIYEDRPVYELSTKTMEKLVEIGAEFGLDIFDYS